MKGKSIKERSDISYSIYSNEVMVSGEERDGKNLLNSITKHGRAGGGKGSKGRKRDSRDSLDLLK